MRMKLAKSLEKQDGLAMSVSEKPTFRFYLFLFKVLPLGCISMLSKCQFHSVVLGFVFPCIGICEEYKMQCVRSFV
jgi:hypothetical protein